MSEIPVQVGDWLTLDDLQGKGRQAGEGELDLDVAPACKLPATSSIEIGIANMIATGPDVDAGAVAQLEAMGFPTVRCQKALLATGNSGADMAMSWLFEHMEDAGELYNPSPSRYRRADLYRHRRPYSCCLFCSCFCRTVGRSDQHDCRYGLYGQPGQKGSKRECELDLRSQLRAYNKKMS